MMPLGARFIAQAVGGTLLAGSAARVFTALSSDSRTCPADALFVPLSGPRFDGHAFLADVIARGAGGALMAADRVASLPPRPEGFALIAVPDVLRALGDLARALRDRHPGRFVAITGSSGKTTLKEMVAAALTAFGPVGKTAGNLNNHIGLPLTLASLAGHERHVVLELGMSAPGEIAHLAHLARPDVAAVTMAAEAHLASFRSVDDIADAKCELFDHLPAGAVAVANADDPRIRARAEAMGQRPLVTWGLAADATVRVLARALRPSEAGAGPRLAVSLMLGAQTISLELQSLALHDAHNAAGALAIVHALGLDVAAAAAALAEGFRPAPHRLNPGSPAPGLLVVDDAYNANPASMRGALATMAELARLTPGVRQALVLGTMHELGGAAPELHHAVGAAAGALAPALVVTTGPEAAALAAGVRATSPGGSRVLAVGDISEAAEVLASVAATASPASPLQVLLKGSRAERLERAVALLSPAAAPETRGGA